MLVQGAKVRLCWIPVIHLSAELSQMPGFFSTDGGGRYLVVIGATASHFAHQKREGGNER
ncbi:hypothetical protein PMI35_03011 [Pseudomonas sp. GM78]|nr:hypothetical protein PMI35_03011 [Pseudomonas sp. GM78]